MAFGKNLARVRKEKGMTQEVLARNSNVAVSQIRRYETDKSSPMLEVVEKIAKTLGVSTDELIFGNSDAIASYRVLDRELLQQFEMISKLDEDEKGAVKKILEAVIVKNRIAEVMPTKRDESWSMEMKAIVENFRKKASKYSDEEIEKIVDEAVEAVRNEERAKLQQNAA